MLNEMLTTNEGIYPTYAWPGGYPIFYITQDYGILCPDCANEHHHIDDKQWNVIAAEVNWEDDQVWCDHCSARIEPAYGD